MKRKQQIKDNHHTWQEVMDKKKEMKSEVKESKNKEQTEIKFIPREKFVVVSVKSELNKKLSANKAGLILDTDLSDAEKQRFGGNSKSADMANKTGEEQEQYRLVAVGYNCDYKVGDIVLFRPGAQPTAITVEGKYFLVLGEFDILGLML